MLAAARTAQAAKMRDRKRGEPMPAEALAEFGATGGGRPASAIYRLLQLALHVLNAFWHWLRQLMLPTHEWLQFERFRLH